jgi:hypothetical protein
MKNKPTPPPSQIIKEGHDPVPDEIVEIRTGFQKMRDEWNNRPFYQKLWTSILFFFMSAKGEVMYYFFGARKNQQAIDHVITHIKDDIEFGYDLDIIYNKIMNGAYYNTPIDPKHDHFETNGIDWEIYLDRQKESTIIKQIQKSFRVAKKRNWGKMYYFFDVHETIILPDYNNTDPLEFYPYAKEALLLMCAHPMIVNVIYTCSHGNDIDRYVEFFKSHGIVFDYINENPDITNTSLGCFDKKPYMNVLFEDKAGFNAEEEWKNVYNYFKEISE